MPRSCGLMRPSGVTALASVITSAAPPTARVPRWTKCQSFENPSTLEYWHIGDTTMRLASVSERSGSGSRRCDILLEYVEPLTRHVVEGRGADPRVVVARHRESDVHRGAHRNRHRSDRRPAAAVGRLRRGNH